MCVFSANVSLSEDHIDGKSMLEQVMPNGILKTNGFTLV